MLDSIDLAILKTLQENGRIKRVLLAEKVGLSLPSVSERLRKLEEQKIILGYHAKLDHRKMGKDVTAFINVQIDTSRHYNEFIELAKNNAEILEVHAITGEGSFSLKVRTDNTLSLEKLLSTIQSWPGVLGTRTSIVLSSPKESTSIMLKS